MRDKIWRKVIYSNAIDARLLHTNVTLYTRWFLRAPFEQIFKQNIEICDRRSTFSLNFTKILKLNSWHKTIENDQGMFLSRSRKFHAIPNDSFIIIRNNDRRKTNDSNIRATLFLPFTGITRSYESTGETILMTQKVIPFPMRQSYTWITFLS